MGNQSCHPCSGLRTTCRSRVLRRQQMAGYRATNSEPTTVDRKVVLQLVPLKLTVPTQISSTDVTGSTIVLETALDDNAEVWVHGKTLLPCSRKASSLRAPQTINSNTTARRTSSERPATASYSSRTQRSTRRYLGDFAQWRPAWEK